MSSILKALKKAENDNATRRPDELRIDTEILRTNKNSQFSSPGVLMASLLLMAFGAAATYLYMIPDKKSEQPIPNSSTVSGQKQQLVSSTQNVKTEELPPDIVVAPAEQQIISEGVRAQKQLPSSQKATVPTVPKQPIMSERPVLPTERANLVPSLQNSSNVPAIRVNGIAFQDDGLGTIAMINGEPLSKGEIIAGVKVEEIYKNRVKFSYNGEVFEVPMGQSNR